MPANTTPSARQRVYRLLESPRGDGNRALELVIVTLIVANVVAVMLESIPAVRRAWATQFAWFEACSVAVFTVEYLLRVWACVEDTRGIYVRPVLGRLRYARTPLAVIDLFAVLPFYLGAAVGLDLRFLRVARLVRVFKLTRYSAAMGALLGVFRDEADTFLAALFLLLVMLVFASAGIYYFEHGAQPEAFSSIPAAVWWAVATLTTVGYGDVTPVTQGGRLFGGLVMVVGIGVVAIPAGILASAFSEHMRTRRETYMAVVDRALADGRISESDRHRLERARVEIGLSRAEARLILTRIAREVLVRDGVCPECGAVIGRRRGAADGEHEEHADDEDEDEDEDDECDGRRRD